MSKLLGKRLVEWWFPGRMMRVFTFFCLAYDGIIKTFTSNVPKCLHQDSKLKHDHGLFINTSQVSINNHSQLILSYTLLKPKCHSLCCHSFVVHTLLLRMHTNVVDFRVMRRLCRREWNWQWNWQSVNQHSWDPWQRTTWSRRVTSDFNSV